MMEIALVGKQLIHEDPYLTYFNGVDRSLLEQHGKKWMRAFLLRQSDLSPQTHEARITRVWSPVAEAARRVAAAFRVSISPSLEKALEGVQGAMVMDEDIASRGNLVEQCLDAGLRVFADKMLSPDPARHDAILDRARRRGADVRSWSQAFFYRENEALRALGPGGFGSVSAHYNPHYALAYGPHAVSALQGAWRLKVLRYEPIRHNAKERIGLLMLDGDTQIVTCFAERLSPQVMLSYRPCVDGGSPVLLNDTACDYGASFERSARALLDFFMGRECPVTTEGMQEHSRIMHCLFAEGDAGECVGVPHNFPQFATAAG